MTKLEKNINEFLNNLNINFNMILINKVNKILIKQKRKTGIKKLEIKLKKNSEGYRKASVLIL